MSSCHVFVMSSLKQKFMANTAGIKRTFLCTSTNYSRKPALYIHNIPQNKACAGFRCRSFNLIYRIRICVKLQSEISCWWWRTDGRPPALASLHHLSAPRTSSRRNENDSNNCKVAILLFGRAKASVALIARVAFPSSLSEL